MYVYCVESFVHIECYYDCPCRRPIWLNPFATVLFNVCSAVPVECYVLYPCCVGLLAVMYGRRLFFSVFTITKRRDMQGVRLAIAHSPVAIGNVGGLLEGLSMVAHWASGNKIDNIMVARFISVSLNTIPVLQLQEVTLFGKSNKSYMLMSNIIV